MCERASEASKSRDTASCLHFWTAHFSHTPPDGAPTTAMPPNKGAPADAWDDDWETIADVQLPLV